MDSRQASWSPCDPEEGTTRSEPPRPCERIEIASCTSTFNGWLTDETQSAGDSATGTRSAVSPSVSVQPAGSPVSQRAVSGPPTSADWAALARDLSGSLVRPGEADYTTAKRLFDPRFDYLNPAGVAYCEGPHDVSTCLAFAGKYGVPVAARCGGHSYAGWSSTSGLIIDVTRMAGVSVSGGTASTLIPAPASPGRMCAALPWK